jgi:hypothetical protein
MSYLKCVSVRRLEVIITFAMTQEAVSRLSHLTESAPIANVTPVTIARPPGIPSQVVTPSKFDYPQKYASHMVGKGGENVQRLHQKYDVNVQINDDKVQLKDYAGSSQSVAHQRRASHILPAHLKTPQASQVFKLFSQKSR